MTIQRVDPIGIVVEDLAAATAFYVDLGLTPVGQAPVEGAWADRIIGLEGVRSRIMMLETSDGHGRVELSSFDFPPSPGGGPPAPANAPGLCRLTLAGDDVDDVVDRGRGHGVELVGEGVSYKDLYRLFYVCGPAGIIVELARRLL